MAVQSVKEPEVYRKGYELSMNIFEATKNFPQEERYSLTGQIRRPSRSVFELLGKITNSGKRE